MKKQVTLKNAIRVASALCAVVFFTYAMSEDSPFREPPDPVHPINFVKVQIGMSMKEVEAILGEWRIYGVFAGSVVPTTWCGSRFAIHIELDNQGLVKNKTIEMRRFVTPSLADRYYMWIYRL